MSDSNHATRFHLSSRCDDAYSIERYRNIEVCWLPELDGGGREVGQNFIPLVKHLFGKVGRLFDMCAGAGFIGFSILAQDLCDSLILSDVNPAAVDALRDTVRRNGLEDRVTVYHSDGLKNIPKQEKCDLVVVNPPCFPAPLGLPGVDGRITDDPGWEFHRAFYAHIGHLLAPGASVLTLETSMVSTPEDFLPMIEAGGLQALCPLWFNVNRWSSIYYMWSKPALPGLFAGNADPEPVLVELQQDPQRTVTLATQLVHVLRLCNGTRQRLSVRIVDATGAELLGLTPPIPELGPEEKLDTSKLVLRPGRYKICDAANGSTLATLDVPHSSEVNSPNRAG